jgi:hypothetical protein
LRVDLSSRKVDTPPLEEETIGSIWEISVWT